MQRSLSSFGAFLLYTALSLSFASGAEAQAPPSEGERLIEEGVRLRRAGDDEGALRSFAAAWETGNAPRARGQMGLAEQALGRWVDAHAHLTETLRFADDPWVERNRATLESSLAAVRAHLGSLDLRGGVAGAVVRVNGAEAGRLPLPAPVLVAPGSVVVEITADGYYPLTRTVTVAAGALARETIDLVALPPPPPETIPATTDPTGRGTVDPATSPGRRETVSDPGEPFRAVGIGGMSFGGALVLSGVVLLIIRESAAQSFNGPTCLTGGMSRGQNCRNSYDLAVSTETASIGVFVAGGTLAVAGLLVYLLAPSAPAPSIACGPGPGEVGIACGGWL